MLHGANTYSYLLRWVLNCYEASAVIHHALSFSDVYCCRYGGPSCSPCSPGTYGLGGRYEECLMCGLNQTSPPLAKDDSRCMCMPGYGGPSCLKCPGNTFAFGAGKDDCTRCPSNSGSPAGSADPTDCGKLLTYIRGQCRCCCVDLRA